MRWKITIEGMDEFGGLGCAEMVIESGIRRMAPRFRCKDAQIWRL